jgi:hypothetical protein
MPHSLEWLHQHHWVAMYIPGASSSRGVGMSCRSMHHQYSLAVYFSERKDRDNADRIHSQYNFVVSRRVLPVRLVVLDKTREDIDQSAPIDIFRTWSASLDWSLYNCIFLFLFARQKTIGDVRNQERNIEYNREVHYSPCMDQAIQHFGGRFYNLLLFFC